MAREDPHDRAVLRLQAQHRSEDVGGIGGDRVLTMRGHLHWTSREWVVDDRIMDYVRRAGFYGIHRLRSCVDIDRPLITALVERWRQETHTFHLTVGEATITLQDVAVILGLRVHGEAITGSTERVWSAEVEELLGVDVLQADPSPLEGGSLNMAWLRERFAHMPPDADDHAVQCYSRAYILFLIGTILFADKSGDAVQLMYLPLLRDLDRAGSLSWGSGTLAFLYRQLCRAAKRGARQIGGALILVQLWSWEHISIGRPVVDRLRHVPGPGDPQPEEPEVDETILGSQHERGVDSLACR